MSKPANQKHSPPTTPDTQRKSKYFKPNDANGNKIGVMSKKPNSKQMKPANGIMDTIDGDDKENDDASSLSSSCFAPLFFPTI